MPLRVLLSAVLLFAVHIPGLPAETIAPGDPRALSFGVFPYVSATQLVRFHAPLRDYIAQVLGRPVTLVTAPDFATFVKRTRDGVYDIVLTAPHFGRLAERRDGYRRLARTNNEIYGVFLVPSDSAAQRIEDLRGKRVMMAQRLAVIYQIAEQELREKGLRAGRDVTLIETSTHNNAMSAPLRGDADAAVIPAAVWAALAAGNRDRLREIAHTRTVPGAMIMANRYLPEGECSKLRAALLAFPDTDAGKRYFAATGMRGFGAIPDSDMESLDPYLGMLESLR